MGRTIAGIVAVILLFSLIIAIPRGFSQINIELNYLVDSYNGVIEVNLTAPYYITSIPVKAYDGEGKLLFDKEIDRYFTKRMDKYRFNRFIFNMTLTEKVPVKVVLFPGETLQRTYTLRLPEMEIVSEDEEVKVYLAKNSKFNLAVSNATGTKEYSILAEKDGWYYVDLSDLSRDFLSPGTALYSSIRFPGGLSTTVTRYIPSITVDVAKEYTGIRGCAIGGEAPKIFVYNSEGGYKGAITGITHFKEGKFIFEDTSTLKDGDVIVYREKDYSFRFKIPYFLATYRPEDNSIVGTVSRKGKVVFKYGSQLLEAVPDRRGRFKILLGVRGDPSKLISIKGGYISPAGNQYWKRFDWGYRFKATPLVNGVQMDLKVMTYNIHHGISTGGRLNIDEIASVIAESGTQVVGLQEVDKRFIRSLFQDQVRLLAEKLNMYYYFGETFNILGAEYGNAVLSKFPIVSASNLQLDSAGEQRGILSAKIDVNGKQVNFVVTHLSLNKHVRNKQIQQLKSYLDLLEEEVILVGDFNATPDQEEIMFIERYLKDAVKEIGKEEIYTFVKRDGTGVRIDYIFLSPGMAIGDVYTIESRASDHLPLLADVIIRDA